MKISRLRVRRALLHGLFLCDFDLFSGLFLKVQLRPFQRQELPGLAMRLPVPVDLFQQVLFKGPFRHFHFFLCALPPVRIRLHVGAVSEDGIELHKMAVHRFLQHPIKDRIEYAAVPIPPEIVLRPG